MFTRIADHIAESPRESLFFAVLAVVAAGLLVALYLVCSGQVHRAAMRDSVLKTQREAVASCLDASHRATLTSCVAEVARARDDVRAAAAQDGGFVRASLPQAVPMAGGQAAVGAIKPIAFSYR